MEAEDRAKADELAYAFLANLQKEHDAAYKDELDKAGLKYRKREEIEERRPIYLRELRRRTSEDPNPFDKKGEKVISERRLAEFYQDPATPPKVQVDNYVYEQHPVNFHYRFFRLLTEHQVSLGFCLLALVVLSILFWPSFREMGILSVLNIE